MRLAATYLIGLLFGIGIVLSGMANPAKVLNFFDVFGAWDPSLMFVMGGAVVTTLIGYRLVFARQAPLIAPRFMLPTATAIDRRLLFGAGLFGIGWGIAGFCPGGALPAIGTGRPEVFTFVAGLGIGIVATRLALAHGASRPRAATEVRS
ncbi:MAG: DUF6691 family protein [Hyphomicrobiaceae bacterium]